MTNTDFSKKQVQVSFPVSNRRDFQVVLHFVYLEKYTSTLIINTQKFAIWLPFISLGIFLHDSQCFHLSYHIEN